MSTETLASRAKTRQAGAAKMSTAIKTRFIMRQIRAPYGIATSQAAARWGTLLSRIGLMHTLNAGDPKALMAPRSKRAQGYKLVKMNHVAPRYIALLCLLVAFLFVA